MSDTIPRAVGAVDHVPARPDTDGDAFPPPVKLTPGDNLTRYQAAVADLDPRTRDHVHHYVFGWIIGKVDPTVVDAAVASARDYYCPGEP